MVMLFWESLAIDVLLAKAQWDNVTAILGYMIKTDLIWFAKTWSRMDNSDQHWPSDFVWHPRLLSFVGVKIKVVHETLDKEKKDRGTECKSWYDNWI